MDDALALRLWRIFLHAAYAVLILVVMDDALAQDVEFFKSI